MWNIGILIQKSKDVIVGARAENLNRGRIDGARTDRRFVYGIAARVYRQLAILTFEADMTQSESLSMADYRTGLEIRPKRGMYLFVDFDNHSQFNVGFRLNLGKSFVGHYQKFDRHGQSYLSTSFIGSVNGKQPSLTSSRGRPGN
jgi:hypothetical protein